jgi:serine/threonine protein kinase/Tfp pilus assembly protein PilF
MSERSIFLAALEVSDPVQRSAYLDAACGTDAVLRRQVEGLLASHEAAGSFLEPPTTAEAVTSKPPAEEPGSRLGPYKLLQQLGEGGMGTVWMAEQQEPVRRKVALKVIKAGLDSKQVLARFETERQALALMDHPNIARVLDAGQTQGEPGGIGETGRVSAGRPYFVMELVKGVSLTRFCDERRLPVRERLELFVGVCQAVQHAHTKGIIHRDLKPSNVLVALYDGRPVPKVIDFGISKATDQPLTERTLFTGFGAVVGTLEYMSPEQAELNQLDIDTRSDLYALGVLLYELLTGTTPLERKQLKETGLLEVLRVIREVEPPTPSTRLGTTEELPIIAANRGLEPRRLSGLFKGELDWIVMKALEKDRNRRYDTASAFALDLQCYLADEPVQAGPPSKAYRLKKFVRRNKGPVLAGLLILVVLLVGILGTSIGLWRARNEAIKAARERDEAEAARDRAAATLDAMTSDNAGEALTQQQALTPEQKQFLTTALDYYRELLKETVTDDAARKRIAGVAYRVGEIEYRLGRKDEAAALFRQARDLYAQLVREFPAVAAYRFDLARSRINLGLLLADLGRWQQAETEYRAALDLWSKLATDFPAEPRHRHYLAYGHNNLGLLLMNLGQWDRAETELRATLRVREGLAAEFPLVPDTTEKLAASHNNLGTLLRDLGKSDQAETEYRAALDLRSKVATRFPALPENRHGLAADRANLAHLLCDLGRWPQAETEYRAALGLASKLTAEFPGVPSYRQSLATGHLGYGQLFVDLGKKDLAEREFRTALDLFGQLATEFLSVPDYRQSLARSHNSLGLLLAELGKLTQAEAQYRAALALDEKLATEFPAVPAYRQALAGVRTNIGNLLQESRKPEQAEKEFRTALDMQKKLTEDHPRVPTYHHQRAIIHTNSGNLLRSLNRMDQAEEQYRAGIDAGKQAVALAPGTPVYRRQLANGHTGLGNLLRSLKKPKQAETEFQNALAFHRKLAAAFPSVPEYAMDLGGSLCNLGSVLTESGRPNEALGWFDQAIAALSPLVKQEPTLSLARRFLLNSHSGRGETLDQLKRYGEAIRDWARALDLSTTDNRPYFHLMLMLSRAHAQHFEAALKDADLLAKSEFSNVVYGCACVYALAHAQTKDDKQAVRAVELLRRAAARGYRNVMVFKNNTDLASLRTREDFQQFLADMEKVKSPPTK